MASKALFGGLVIDEADNLVEITMVGGEAFYVIDDDGFKRHVESEYVDRQVLDYFQSMMEGQEDVISEGAMKMLGQEDIFTKAAIEASLKNIDKQFDELFSQGLPEEAQAWMGMLGFRVIVDIRGDVVKIEQPSAPDPDE